jgi:predicted HAD superfamily hydrolase
MNIPSSIQLVSFDIFDTLIHRRLAKPTDIFASIRSKLCECNISLFCSSIVQEFPSLRIEAEKSARQKRQNSHGDSEVTLSEIYDEFKKNNSIDENSVKLLIETELAMENTFIYLSPHGKKLYDATKLQGIKTIFVSDMYLPTSFIKEIMIRLGYIECNDSNLFISCNIRKNKHHGLLYDHISKQFNIKFKNWMHIGDNLHSDIKMADKRGIKTLHASYADVGKNLHRNYLLNDSLPCSIVESLDQKHFSTPDNINCDFSKQGYAVFGPLAFGFYIWLLKQFREYNPDKILFFARDAQLIMKIHEIISKRINLLDDIPFSYVYASRKSLFEMGLDLTRLNYLINGKSPGNVTEIFEKLGLDTKNYLLLISGSGLSPETKIEEKNRYQMRKLLNKLYESLLAKSSESRRLFQSYFCDIISDSKKVAIVDIGWSGNIQSSFLRSIGEKWASAEYKGFYLGTFVFIERNYTKYSKALGWIVNRGLPNCRNRLLGRGGIELLEFALTADHGSTLGYQFDNDGKILPILEKKTKEEQIYEKNAMSLQKGVLTFISDHIYLLEQFPIASLVSDGWQKPFNSLMKHPTDQQIRLFGDLTHSENVGSNSVRRHLAPKVSFLDCMLRGKSYCESREKAFWKSAFYRRNTRRATMKNLWSKLFSIKKQ